MQAAAHASITSLCRSSHGLHRVTHCKDVNHTAAGFSAVIFVRIFRSGLKEVEELQFDPKDGDSTSCVVLQATRLAVLHTPQMKVLELHSPIVSVNQTLQSL
ncbi:hypothetical protein CFC21_098503 [Triticum aestivum]|uniref:Uncharacterized protein n=2 Tax=Triticum aestivum TaxID=4565 RepID=A0A3B6RHF0_WHEAT|nr:hypothetical protein CFC21_098503 [Triticum aestivum]